MGENDFDELFELMGPGRYIVVLPQNAGAMVLRIRDDDRIRLDAYGERMEVRLAGLSAFVHGLEHWRLDADAIGLEQFRVE